MHFRDKRHPIQTWGVGLEVVHCKHHVHLKRFAFMKSHSMSNQHEFFLPSLKLGFDAVSVEVLTHFSVLCCMASELWSVWISTMESWMFCRVMFTKVPITILIKMNPYQTSMGLLFSTSPLTAITMSHSSQSHGMQSQSNVTTLAEKYPNNIWKKTDPNCGW